jgi:hypothetical protein
MNINEMTGICQKNEYKAQGACYRLFFDRIIRISLIFLSPIFLMKKGEPNHATGARIVFTACKSFFYFSPLGE